MILPKALPEMGAGAGAPPGPRTIAYGDLVIVYERHDRMKPAYVTAGGAYSNRFGAFDHDDWVGKPFGSKVLGRGGKGFVYVLAPTPELWTLALPHRTQILYLADISTVVNFLELRPGSVVLESGTGSGSLSHSLARAVAPTGHVYTFEFHAERAKAAWHEFKKNELQDLVTVTLRDVEGEGFPDDLAGMADGVFLDLPGPHNVVPSAAKSLRPNGVLCSFSPCIEQVQKACLAMRAHGFKEILTVEILAREYDVDRFQQRPMGGKQEEAPQQQKRKYEELNKGGDADAVEESAASAAAAGEQDKDAADTKPSAASAAKASAETDLSVVAAKPCVDARGHTGYLTFGRLAV